MRANVYMYVCIFERSKERFEETETCRREGRRGGKKKKEKQGERTKKDDRAAHLIKET